MTLVKPSSPVLQWGDPLAEGLIGAWPIYEGAGARLGDLSGQGRNGAFSGSPLPAWTGGPFGAALLFNNGGYADTGPLTLPANVSLTAWITPTVLDGTYRFQVSSDPGGGTSGIGIALYSGNDFYFAIRNGYQVAPGTLTAGMQYFVCGTGNTGSGRPSIYLNGVLQTGGFGADVSGGSNGGNLCIGSQPAGAGPAKSTIEGVRLYNRILSAAEIAAIYADEYAIYRPRRASWLFARNPANAQLNQTLAPAAVSAAGSTGRSITPIGIGTAALYPRLTTAGSALDTLADPGDSNAPIILEPPPALSGGDLEVWVIASGGANWGGCEVWISTDNATYALAGTIYRGGRQGILTANLASHADPDTSDTLAIDLTQSQGQLLSGTTADADNFVTLCYCDGEPL